MRREHLKARLLRALSGKTQEQIGEEIDVHPTLIAQFETGKVVPGHEHLARLARGAGLTAPDAEDLLRLYETLRSSRRRRGRNAEDLFDGMVEALRSHAKATYRHLLTLPLPDSPPQAEDRLRAGELFGRLVDLAPETSLAVIRVAEEYQSWALCERVCHASEREASQDVERAAAWARLGQEIAEQVRGPEAWRNRIKGYAGGHVANVMRVMGELKKAEAGFDEAKRLWHSGSDPGGVLDPGRLLDLEASLRRDQRRCDEALALLDEAVAVGCSPERALIKKGITLEKMGEFERAIETLLEAAPRIARNADPRLGNTLDFNLATNFCHVGRYGEAAELVPRMRELAVERGDEIDLIRMDWLEGRIAAGLGRPSEAQGLLAQARREFDRRQMSYDVALALLEEAALLLEEGGSVEVQRLARELTEVFESKGVHREALAALRLFHEAVEREEATAELARRVLRYLFRARYDQGLRFES